MQAATFVNPNLDSWSIDCSVFCYAQFMIQSRMQCTRHVEHFGNSLPLIRLAWATLCRTSPLVYMHLRRTGLLTHRCCDIQ